MLSNLCIRSHTVLFCRLEMPSDGEDNSIDAKEGVIKDEDNMDASRLLVRYGMVHLHLSFEFVDSTRINQSIID